MSDYSGIRVEAQRSALFETPIVMAKFSNAEGFLDDLEARIRARRDADPEGMRRSNVGGWHSDTHMLDWGGPAAQLLSERAIAIAKRLSGFKDGTPDDFNWWVQMWANISGPGASNHMHVHPGHIWSAVLYLDMGGAGETGDDTEGVGGTFYFEDPRFPIAAMHNTRFRYLTADGSQQSWQPELRTRRGDLLMFPAWLRHGVRPYHGDRERISIALNIDAYT